MGLFHKNKTDASSPPPPASVPSHEMSNSYQQTQGGGLPVQNTGNTTTTYTPTNEVPAPQYTPGNQYPQTQHHDGSYVDGIQTAPPPAAGYNEKTAAINHDPNQQPHVYGNQDPSVVNSGYVQPTPGQGQPGQYSQSDFHAQDKAQYGQQQHYNQGPPPASYNPQQGRNNYQTALPLRSLQQGPEAVDCPVCGVRDVTRTEYTSGGTTHLSALLCCLCLCLGCIPYMATWFKDCEHYCGNCGVLLAVWHRSGRTEVFGKGKPGAPPPAANAQAGRKN